MQTPESNLALGSPSFARRITLAFDSLYRSLCESLLPTYPGVETCNGARSLLPEVVVTRHEF